MSLAQLPFNLIDGTLVHHGGATYSLSVSQTAVCLTFGPSRTAGVQWEEGTPRTLCLSDKTRTVCCDGNLWLLPERRTTSHATLIRGTGGKTAQRMDAGVAVTLAPGTYTLLLHDGWPACDILGNRLRLQFEGGDVLEAACARFYWDTLLPSVIERTDAQAYPLPEGYVVSTLAAGEYAGTYPDVDHEFQTKGRHALRGPAEMAVVERMMALQFLLMREDPTGLCRNPCAIQPNGDREYHVRRDSLDRSTNAEMFLVTGNVEILETAWRHVALTGDMDWLAAHIDDLEGAASLLAHLTDRNGKLWSDVYYEDQVIKDGMECMSAALAARNLSLLADLEALLAQPREDGSESGPSCHTPEWQAERRAAEARFRHLSARIAGALVKPVPEGFWDPANHRFVDWIDRNGKPHDHLHLLANCLPVLFGHASEAQAGAVRALIEANLEEYQRFPTFLSPRIADYTPDEIGCAGPYDLCAAGRYWCWDAAYWSHLGRGDRIGRQLFQVADQAKADGYRMGERYDMNHVYYQDDRNWHGAAWYYEYPCVFLWVLLHEWLGLRPALDVDLALRPLLDRRGTVTADAYGISYECRADAFSVTNTAGHSQTLRLDLSHAYPDRHRSVQEQPFSADTAYTLGPGETLSVLIH